MPDLLGYGSHGKDIATIWGRSQPGKELRLYDDDPKKGVLPLKEAKRHVIIGVNDPAKRREMAEMYTTAFGAPKAIVDPSVILGSDVHLARGVVIAPFCLLLDRVDIGQHTHINYGVHMTRTVIGVYTTIAPDVTICGDVEIGDEVLIGAGAVICDRVKIGNRVTIGAGAVVLPQSVVPGGETWIGIPAKKR